MQREAAPAWTPLAAGPGRAVPGAEAPCLFAGSGLGQGRVLPGGGGLVSVLLLCHEGACCLVAYSNSTVYSDLDDVGLTRI